MKKSFSHQINQLVGVVFGIAFLIVFFASAILLYLSEENTQNYYIKVLGIFAVYLILFAFAVLYVSGKIKKMFLPLDRIASALAEDKIRIYGDTADLSSFAEQLSERMDEMEDISDALSVAEDNLNDMFQESAESRSKFLHHMKRCHNSLELLKKGHQQLASQNRERRKFIDDGTSSATKLRLSRQSLEEDSESIRDSLQECSRLHREIMDDAKRQKEAFDVLNDMQTESMELIDTIYNDLAYIQDIALKLDLYATNATLDYARSGGFNLNISAALDEMKTVDRQMRDKIDELTMLVIRTKNAVKLANDQTNFCIELDDDSRKLSAQTIDDLGFISMKLQGLIQVGEDIGDGISGVLGHYSELFKMEEQPEKTMQFLREEAQRLSERLEEMEQALAENNGTNVR